MAVARMCAALCLIRSNSVIGLPSGTVVAGPRAAAGSSAATFSSAWLDIKAKMGRAAYARPSPLPTKNPPAARSVLRHRVQMPRRITPQVGVRHVDVVAPRTATTGNRATHKARAPGEQGTTQQQRDRSIGKQPFHRARWKAAEPGRYSSRLVASAVVSGYFFPSS